MKWVLLCMLAACGGGHDEDCVKLVDHLADVMGARGDQRDDAIAQCEKQKPPAKTIACALDAKTADAVKACLKGTK